MFGETKSYDQIPGIGEALDATFNSILGSDNIWREYDRRVNDEKTKDEHKSSSWWD